MIKLTNKNSNFLSETILINIEHIVSIFRAPNGENGELVTWLYCHNKESWMVEETPDEILTLIKKSKSK
jgi:hypothetical protein